MQVRHLPNRDHRSSGVTTLKCASAHVPRFLTGSVPPISDRQLPSAGVDSIGCFYRAQAGPDPGWFFGKPCLFWTRDGVSPWKIRWSFSGQAEATSPLRADGDGLMILRRRLWLRRLSLGWRFVMLPTDMGCARTGFQNGAGLPKTASWFCRPYRNHPDLHR